MTTTVIMVSDIHANSTTGLAPLTFNLYTGGTHRANKIQRWIYSRWLEFADRAGEARQRNGGRMVLILNGELADDNRHGKNQLIELHPDGMMRLSIEALKPLTNLLSNDDLLYVTRGTEAHSGPGSWMDNAIGADLGAVESEPGIFSTQNLLVTIDGVRFNVAHHPPCGPGRLPWTQTQYATRLATIAHFGAIASKENPPHIYARGHYHVHGDSHDALPVRALALPSWQAPTDYTYRIGGERALAVGGVVVTCDRGRYEVERCIYDWPIRRYEAI